MRLLGLYREAECSPGLHRSNDALLLEEVAGVLRAHGLAVDLLALDAAALVRQQASLVFSMCQGRPSLERLAQWEREGTRIVNSPQSAFGTYRDRLPHLMESASVAFPATALVPTNAAHPGVDVNGGMWLKRGDMHASISSDVQWVGSAAALRRGLQEFAARGITHAAVQAHQEGDEIKFYGVSRGRFFHWFYPNGGTGRFAVETATLERLAATAAAAAGLDIYGGDVIVAPSGAITLIDLNDWPSFAPCRARAAAAIAGCLMEHIDDAWNSRLVSSANPSAL